MHLQNTQSLVAADDVSTQTFVASDGQELCYRHWAPGSVSDKALILFHRGHEHGGRYSQTVRDLGLGDCHVFAWDQRGHGRSPGERGYAPSIARLTRDMDEFVRHICRDNAIPIENVIVLGHSVSAVIVAAWVHDYAPGIRGMVLATPALRVKLYVPLAIPALRALALVRPKSFISSYVKAKMLTHDPEQAAAYGADPLISKQIAVNVLLDLHDTANRIIADAATIITPTLLMTAGSDWVVKNCAAGRFFQKLGARSKQLHHYPGFGHAIFHEKDRRLAIDAVRDFVGQCFDRPIERPNLLDADLHGPTKDEYDRLCRPQAALCPKRLNFAFQRRLLKTIPMLSQGIRLGWSSGFDSGRSLDHIYANRARGITPLGKMIDRIYLNAIGWRGIRVRKQNIERMLLETIERTKRPGEPVRLVDIASGPGRYILDAIRRLTPGSVATLLRDRNTAGLDAGRKLAAEMGVRDVVYENGDAFDPNSLATIAPPPDIAIVSGLYELFPDNEPIRRSLGGLAKAIRPGGYLIYTNQPWHPQVEMIARVLINREQKPWIMRRRSTAEMDALVAAAGFTKLDMLIDPYGIFTVSVAQKPIT